MMFKENSVWKSGVILYKDETKAEIIEDLQQSVIQIRVSGKHQKALLIIIMHELDQNNETFQKLQCKKLVPCNCKQCKQSVEPEFYSFDELLRFVGDGKEIQCRRSYTLVNPTGLLDGIRESASRAVKKKQNKVFISYSHQDQQWLDKLQKMLKPLTRNNELVWADTDIEVGQLWYEEITEAINVAKVAILLVSPHFLDSKFIVEDELPPILDKAEAGGLTVFWIPISDCLYARTPIADYQAACEPNMPLDDMPTSMQNKVLKKIGDKIAKLMED